MTGKRLDPIGWFIVVLHTTLGHRRAAAFLGQPSHDSGGCVLCRYDQGKAARSEVIDAMGVSDEPTR